MTLKSITLVRHGTSAWSASGQHTSLTDIGLTAQGEQEAHALRDILNLRHYDMVYSSTLRRAHDTARLAGFPDAQLDDDLCEWRYGQYEGKTTKEIQVIDPHWSIFRSGAPGGETPDDVGQRCDRLLAKWHHSGRTHILCFSHGHLLRALATRWLGQDILLGNHLNLDAGSISKLAFEHYEHALALWNYCPYSVVNEA